MDWVCPEADDSAMASMNRCSFTASRRPGGVTIPATLFGLLDEGVRGYALDPENAKAAITAAIRGGYRDVD